MLVPRGHLVGVARTRRNSIWYRSIIGLLRVVKNPSRGSVNGLRRCLLMLLADGVEVARVRVCLPIYRLAALVFERQVVLHHWSVKF